MVNQRPNRHGGMPQFGITVVSVARHLLGGVAGGGFLFQLMI
ncbi:hypothetical protein [Prochlorococcus sp. MIT 0702]|nr:hypothetical protein [Prochlorococcus sp. MIT 0702]KGG26678.1 hypothetical protein EV12_1768 [Prochlorococcus sp. MIT 0701]KGG30234.1 hypothetical protein EV13_0566 [Prochlorococcus sp. MIT 0702]KGG34947.1 hypothetical protein EV14_0991 [Prochlorococcus sp. MIT 0703]